jgi:homospermidine synthase
MKYKVINKFITNEYNNNKINITEKKIIFLGCGAVAKCCLYYFPYFFDFDYNKVIMIDKINKEKYYPVIKYYLKKNALFLNRKITENNCKEFLDALNLKEKDIIIDLTTRTPTLCIFKYCRLNNLFYINTASEQFLLKDINSIAIQHSNYFDIARKTSMCDSVTTLVEYGMNPGLISSFVLKGIDDIASYFIKKKYQNNCIDDELIELYGLKCVEKYRLLAKKLGIRVIHCSEIDTQVVTSNTLVKDKFYNTWSCVGLFDEAYEGIEIAVGTHEKEIPLPQHQIFINGIFSSSTLCIDTKIKSVVPLKIENDKIVFTEIEGNPIQHGECASLYRLLSAHDYAPTMHYVYKLNKHAEQTINKYNEKELLNISLDPNRWEVLMENNHDIEGYDNVGAFFILENSNNLLDNSNNYFTWWCGTILSNDYTKNVLKDKMNSATLIQVMAGVLGGLYWALLPENQNKGLCFGEVVDYKTVFSITEKFLGKIYSGCTSGFSINSSKLVDLIATPVKTRTKFNHL